MGSKPSLADKLKNKQEPPPGDAVSVEENGDDCALITMSPRIESVEQALVKGNIDMNLWAVERHVINSWEMGAVLPSGRIAITPLWQVKVWLKRRSGLTASEFRAQLFEDMKGYSPKYKPWKYNSRAVKPNLLELAPVDPHIGKLSWARETGENYDLDISEHDYLDAVSQGLTVSDVFPIERILMVLGNDLLHTDNAAGTTHAGTPQDVDGRWQKIFVHARQMNVKAIEMALQVAPVDVVIVAGNHDTERMFYLGDVLAAWFANNKHVHIDNEPRPRKYYRYGRTLLGFTHGNEERHAELPRIMAEERPQDWAETTDHEWHTGHFHTRRQLSWVNVNSYSRTTVRILPSLSATDAWHTKKGYISHRCSEAYCYNYDTGYLAHFNAKVRAKDGQEEQKPHRRGRARAV